MHLCLKTLCTRLLSGCSCHLTVFHLPSSCEHSHWTQSNGDASYPWQPSLYIKSSFRYLGESHFQMCTSCCHKISGWSFTSKNRAANEGKPKVTRQTMHFDHVLWSLCITCELGIRHKVKKEGDVPGHGICRCVISVPCEHQTTLLGKQYLQLL